MKTMLTTAITSLIMTMSVTPLAGAETIGLSLSQADARIHNVSVTQSGQIDIRIHTGMRGHGDRIESRTLILTARSHTGEITHQHEYRLHSGQTYASLDMSVVSGWSELVWSASFAD